ncbi:hypothetical protein PTKIN_Ptkin01aG0290200 [Pterospermum kingtungense]
MRNSMLCHSSEHVSALYVLEQCLVYKLVPGKQLCDDLMAMLIAGHETSAAVLTWTFYLLLKRE